jgi:hypothetical protein
MHLHSCNVTIYAVEKAANLSKIAQVVLASSDSGILAGMGQNWTCRGVKIKTFEPLAKFGFIRPFIDIWWEFLKNNAICCTFAEYFPILQVALSERIFDPIRSMGYAFHKIGPKRNHKPATSATPASAPMVRRSRHSLPNSRRKDAARFTGRRRAAHRPTGNSRKDVEPGLRH